MAERAPWARRPLRRDRGATIVIASSALIGLLVSTALVVDLGMVRQVRRSNQAAVDLAALAAGEALGADPAPDARTACAEAVDYLIVNVADLPATVNVPCTTLPATCNGLTAPVTVTDGGTAGEYRIEITYPVTDAAIADPDVSDPSGLRQDDGVPCERLMVDLAHQFASIFGGIVDRDSFDVDADAVVRQVQAGDRRVPSLWLLEPYDCPALSVGGGSSVVVGNATTAGLITIDSDASSCGGSSYTIDANGSTSSITATPMTLTPPAQISLVAMDRLQVTCATGNLNACDPGDVAIGTLFPQPVRRANRATRAPVDHVYNCKSSYPAYHGIDIDDCSGTIPPHVDNLRVEVGAAGTPAGYQRWTDSYGCNNPVVPAAGVTGNWHVNCNNFRITSNDVTFSGGNVVFDGDIALTGGSLSFNTANPSPTLSAPCTVTVVGCIDQSSAGAAWVFMRNGNLVLTGGALNALRTMIFQEGGYFSVAGGSPPVWLAPTEGPFKGLSVWSEEASNKFKISGGASMQLEGTFFTPEAIPLNISGGAPVVPLEAQFVSRQLAVSGGASITLSPNSTLAVVLPPDPPLLIR